MTIPNTFMKQRPTSGCQGAERGKGYRGPLVIGISTGTLLLTLLVFFGGLVAAEKLGPVTEVVKKDIDQVLAILADEEYKKPERAEERRAKLEEIIGGRFDWEAMGKRMLGAHWKKMNDTQWKDFVTVLPPFLSSSFASNIDAYSGEQVEYIKERHEKNFAEVQTKIISSKTDAQLNFRLLKKNGEWRVYDVVISGVSMVKNFRSQFSRTIKSSSYDGLIDELRNKGNHIAKAK